MIEVQATNRTIPVTALSTIAEYHSQLAQNAANEAKQSELKAKDWANKLDGTVDNVEYSAKHYALEAKEQADIAEGFIDDVLTNTDLIAVSADLRGNNTIGTLATNISDVIAVGISIDNINTVADNLTDINNVSNDLTNIDVVAGDLTSVVSVADNLININACASNITDIQNASDNAALAKDWAIKTNGKVDNQDYSAKYYAQRAEYFAGQASTGQSNTGQTLTEQVQADWNEADTTSKAYINNKPVIPVVPSNVSAFNNDSGYLTQHQDISGKADKTEIPTNNNQLINGAGYQTAQDVNTIINGKGFLTQHQDITGKQDKITSSNKLSASLISGLKTVATSGNYSDLTGTPTNVSTFVNDAGYLTSHQDISGKQDKSDLVTSVSSSSTHTQYPSAKCLYDLVGNIETLLAAI